MKRQKRVLAIVLILSTFLMSTVLSNAYEFIMSTASASKLQGYSATNPKTVYAHMSLPSSVFFASTTNPLSSALKRWSKPATGKNFSYTYNGSTPIVALSKYNNFSTVAYMNLSSVSEIPSSAYGAIAIAIRTTSNYNNFDIYLNASEPYGVGLGSGFWDYEGILTHELGHGVGLADTKNAYYFSSTMYYGFLTNSNTYNARTLETDDINGLAALYP